MRNPKKPLTDAEQVAIYYHVFADCHDWGKLFKVARGEEYYNSLTDKSKPSRISEWKNSERVQNEVRKLQYEKQRREEERQGNQTQEETRGETESQNPPKAKRLATDFLNRDEFLKFLNTRANEITDDKLRNDILKMLSDNMRYKESENEGETEIQRFYTPQTCENCPIYNKCQSCKVDQCPKML